MVKKQVSDDQRVPIEVVQLIYSQMLDRLDDKRYGPISVIITTPSDAEKHLALLNTSDNPVVYHNGQPGLDDRVWQNWGDNGAFVLGPDGKPLYGFEGRVMAVNTNAYQDSEKRDDNNGCGGHSSTSLTYHAPDTWAFRRQYNGAIIGMKNGKIVTATKNTPTTNRMVKGEVLNLEEFINRASLPEYGHRERVPKAENWKPPFAEYCLSPNQATMSALDSIAREYNARNQGKKSIFFIMGDEALIRSMTTKMDGQGDYNPRANPRRISDPDFQDWLDQVKDVDGAIALDVAGTVLNIGLYVNHLDPRKLTVRPRDETTKKVAAAGASQRGGLYAQIVTGRGELEAYLAGKLYNPNEQRHTNLPPYGGLIDQFMNCPPMQEAWYQ
ncbi:hypothetical protein KY320_02270 [Candidatus Woesearchaeota archaeon]|nr:hypothetical protein [Candidatus Woesearchaeota archaeon]